MCVRVKIVLSWFTQLRTTALHHAGCRPARQATVFISSDTFSSDYFALSHVVLEMQNVTVRIGIFLTVRPATSYMIAKPAQGTCHYPIDSQHAYFG